MNYEPELIRVDKNGTKHMRRKAPCLKCGGSGYIAYFSFNANGICFDCDGAGWNWENYVERTPEYQEKLDERRAKKEAKRQAELEAQKPEILKQWLVKEGFSPEGIVFLFLGDTYSIKEELKAQGAKFNYVLGWHADHEIEGFDSLKMSKDDLLVEHGFSYDWNVSAPELEKRKADEFKRLHPVDHESEFVGQIGDRLKVLELTVTGAFEFYDDSRPSWMDGHRKVIYRFEDADGNEFKWTTSSFIEAEIGDKVVMAGTVKDHKEYKGVKQTVLTRCKLA